MTDDSKIIVKRSQVGSQCYGAVSIKDCTLDDGMDTSQYEGFVFESNNSDMDMQGGMDTGKRFKRSLTLKDFLASWSIRHSVSTNATNELLKFLKQEDDVPLDVRTLRETPRHTEMVNMDQGSYFHYGLKNCLTDFLFQNEKILANNGTNQLILNFGIDGMQLFFSSKRTAWPIMLSISAFSDVFLVGCYIN